MEISGENSPVTVEGIGWDQSGNVKVDVKVQVGVNQGVRSNQDTLIEKIKTEVLVQCNVAIKKHQQSLADVLARYGNNDKGLPTLQYAIWVGDYYAVKVLLESGANPNSRTSQSTIVPFQPYTTSHSPLGPSPQSALDFAAARGNVKIINLLCDYGANTNPTDNLSFSPLCVAAAYNQVHAMKALISRGADPYYVVGFDPYALKYPAGRTCLECAIFFNGFDSIKYLTETVGMDLNWGPKAYRGGTELPLVKTITSPIFIENPQDRLKIMTYLIDHGADVNYMEDTIYPLLHLVLHTGPVSVPAEMQHEHNKQKLQMMELMLQNGANPDIKVSGSNKRLMNIYYGTSPWVISIRELLLKYGAKNG